MLNELQIVLLIFASVVLIGLYFFSRSRKKTLNKSSENSQSASQSRDSSTDDVKKTHQEPKIDKIKAKEALHNLGSKHSPVSEQTHARITAESQSNLVKKQLSSKAPAEDHVEVVTDSVNQAQQELAIDATIPHAENTLTEEERFNQNQGVLSFGDEFDIPEDAKDKDTVKNENDAVKASDNELDAVEYVAETSQTTGGKHHVLVVDDPGLNGEIDAAMAPEEVKPSFGIPPEQKVRKPVSATNKAPQAFIIMILSTGKEFSMTDVNAALRGVGLTLSDKSIFVKKDPTGNPIIRVANMLEPGTFPEENLENYHTPGVVMILELPTTVRAPAAMDDLILMSRKISQRLGGRLYDMDRHLIRESDIQSMRDTALDYESEPLT